ncbi:MAG: AbrB/MazE/SpoVT family DNA-binding domain-containing protein [Acutalibacteraceae bacterium]|nr:AbrB/MazE/SpoVT family DNA-binding domain-containing protein [Clostridia bacterium]MEE0980783.1 AbrB/MazE/SpoVT family DNA-binding domain-containing protein [Acutalibacteraceae bacterium]
MKHVGIVRSIDLAGRIVLPIEIRKELDLMGEDSKVEIIAKGNEIILRKYADTCIFCHDTADLVDFNGQKICRKCIKDISQI